MRTFIIVIDSFGIGAMPDAYKWHDEGSNTFLHIENTVHPYLPNLTKLGLKDIDGIKIPHTSDVIGNYGRMFERSNGKDTLTGHYEMMGIIQKRPNPTFPNGFPEDLMKKIESATGYQFLGNEVASGTEIIQRLGEEHIKTGKPIVYTSADSVLQIAAHVDVVPLDKLYDLCKQIRALTAKGKYNVARVIARPFAGEIGAFYRTEDRHDFSLLPPKKSVLDKLKKKGYDVLLMDCQLDAHFVNLLETKVENSRFARVDSDSIDNLIPKEERIRPELSEQDKSDLDVIFKSVLPSENNYYVSAENLGENASPILITQSEFMRRYRDMSSLGGGMNFYSEMPESYNITVNMQNPLIMKIMGAKSEAFAGKEVEDPVKDLPNDATEDQKKEAQARKDEAVNARNSELKDFASGNEILKQVTDLALLANGMLKGKDLSDFIARSEQVVADAYLK